jgi:cytochrome oxidase Cu insertion factor (SCO1/SenC/PrrC family)
VKRVLWLALLATAAIGCGDGRERALRGVHGVQLTPVRAKPDFMLENTDGEPFHFAADTRGLVTLLVFGYTNCPDVCPQHLVNIAGALKHMSAKDQERVRNAHDVQLDRAMDLLKGISLYSKRTPALERRRLPRLSQHRLPRPQRHL